MTWRLAQIEIVFIIQGFNEKKNMQAGKV